MLYHVDDLDRALAELARVLEPGGRLVALTVGDGHMAEVWDLVGYERPEKPFRRENGEEHLRRHFAVVERLDVDAALVFPDEAAVHGYVKATFFGEDVPRPLPPVDGSFRASVCATVFVATR
jgi:SAM-dependent methyltransferase